MIGVMKSRLPASVGILAINHVSHIARVGSADGDDGMNSFKKGIVSSAAIAARSCGALNIKRNKCLGYMCIYTELYIFLSSTYPVKHCKAAPTLLIMIPIFTTSSCGKVTAITISLSVFKA